jgi:FkbM family methyltransferase
MESGLGNIISQIYHASDRRSRIRKEIHKNNRRLRRLFGLAMPPRMPAIPVDKCVVAYQWNGLSVLLDRTSLVDRCIIENGNWESAQILEMQAAIEAVSDKNDTVFLDVGAYWGLYGMLAHKMGVQHVHLFEPDKRNRAQLYAQLYLNGLHDAFDVYDFAASDKVGEMRFRRSTDIEDGNRGNAGRARANDASEYVVPCQPIDNCLTYEGRTIFCKIDVEGAEIEALKGMRNLLANNRMFLQIEVFDENQTEFEAFAKEIGLNFVKRIDIDNFYTNY